MTCFLNYVVHLLLLSASEVKVRLSLVLASKLSDFTISVIRNAIKKNFLNSNEKAEEEEDTNDYVRASERLGENFLNLLLTDELLCADLPATELCSDFLDVTCIAVVARKSGSNAEALEELLDVIDAFLCQLLVTLIIARDVEHLVAHASKLLLALREEEGEQARMDDGQSHTMVEAVEGCQFMTDLVGCPALAHTTRNDTVQSHGSRPEVIATGLVVGLFRLEGRGSHIDDGAQKALRLFVLDTAHVPVAGVLLHDMNECIRKAVGNLLAREGEGRLRVQD